MQAPVVFAGLGHERLFDYDQFDIEEAAKI